MAEKMMRAAEEVVEILKPRTDKRRYRRLILPNSLEALLISDPDTDKVIHPLFLSNQSINLSVVIIDSDSIVCIPITPSSTSQQIELTLFFLISIHTLLI